MSDAPLWYGPVPENAWLGPAMCCHPQCFKKPILRPVFGENARTAELERWLDSHGDALDRGADEPTAILIADEQLIFDGLDWRRV